MTLSPFRIASCVAMIPTDPPAPRINRVSRQLVSDRYAIYVSADGVDGSGGLKAEDRGLWEREHAVEVAAADLQIRGTDAGDTNLDQDLPLGRLLRGNVVPPENVGGAKLS